MREDDVPQFERSAYGGHRKLLYAVDRDGRYTRVESVGCEIEAAATYDAIADLEASARDAFERARSGDAAPLLYHMYRRRMDVALLAETAGLARWRVRRHLRADRFARLPARILRRYAEALDMEIAALASLPEAP